MDSNVEDGTHAFAELGENNVVMRQIMVRDIDTIVYGKTGDEAGSDFICKFLQEEEGRWVKITKARSARSSSTNQGDTYHEARQAFVPPKPTQSFVLNSENRWVTPIPKPSIIFLKEGHYYDWDEDTGSWLQFEGDCHNCAPESILEGEIDNEENQRRITQWK